MTCFGSTSETNTGIRLYSRDLYGRLEAETGQATGFKPVGMIEAAADADRLEEYRRVAAFQRHLGWRSTRSPRGEMAELFPWANTDDLLAGFHIPGDGRVNPVDLTTVAGQGRPAARRPRHRGRRRHRRAHRRRTRDRRAGAAGRTRRATTIECEYVVNCTGMWARELGERNGAGDPQPGGRALLPDHRHHRRARPGRADLRGPVLLRLLPRRGRRDDGRALRAAAPRPWKVERHPAPTSRS